MVPLVESKPQVYRKNSGKYVTMAFKGPPQRQKSSKKSSEIVKNLICMVKTQKNVKMVQLKNSVLKRERGGWGVGRYARKSFGRF